MKFDLEDLLDFAIFQHSSEYRPLAVRKLKECDPESSRHRRLTELIKFIDSCNEFFSHLSEYDLVIIPEDMLGGIGFGNDENKEFIN